MKQQKHPHYFKQTKKKHTLVSIGATFLLLFYTTSLLNATARRDNTLNSIVSASTPRSHQVHLLLEDNRRMVIDFYAENIFRLFSNGTDTTLFTPQATPPAEILVSNPRTKVSTPKVVHTSTEIEIKNTAITLIFNKKEATITLLNNRGDTLMHTLRSIEITPKQVEIALKEYPNEYFYGGGVQNGRFSHKGRTILIENTNSWTDGGVASPTPFYWSTKGYGIMWHTFRKGKYDFGHTEANTVKLSHETDYLDLFVMASDTPQDILSHFYQLTGNPVLIPFFGFYQGHLNAYNRDYWKEDEKGILFEDGKRYKESQKDNGGIKESLNGESNNYQFSARAVIDRYEQHDMPLGWVLPNDGYGAGYGQGETLDENIQNLRKFTQYAQEKGVEVGLWTQSDLHPKPDVLPLLQRDIIKEVKDAGVRVLKTDVAWVGAGYSFGLNGIADVAQIMPEYGNDARPFIITLDGWAGTQRYAGIWSGDQTGGEWEYIRFHIPTYIGSGLSGNPNISSDMDGIFGGNKPIIQTRDFQWKTLTPMQLNMDGWGANEKYPHALGQPATDINRAYLKLRSQLMPYIYTEAWRATTGEPMVRAMMLDEKNSYTLGRSTQYQFLFGKDFLVAPIYQDTQSDKDGNDVRNHIYLPQGEWIDYFTGHKYQGGCVLNNFEAPLWKLPLFVRKGAIIPLYNPHNQPRDIDYSVRIYEIYPDTKSSYTQYEDDGVSQRYLHGAYATTRLDVQTVPSKGVVVVVNPTEGTYKGAVSSKATHLRVHATQKPSRVDVKITTNGKTKRIRLQEVMSEADLNKRSNVFYVDNSYRLPSFASSPLVWNNLAPLSNMLVNIQLENVDVHKSTIEVELKGLEYQPKSPLYKNSTPLINAPTALPITEEQATPYTLSPQWSVLPDADFYEIAFEGMTYTGISQQTLLFENLQPKTDYTFQLRAVNASGASPWTTIHGTTLDNPFEFAIHPITVSTTSPNQGNSLSHLCDLVEGEIWHTRYAHDAIPFEINLDLNSINQLDKVVYIPRDNAGNGTILEGTLSYSKDGKQWHEIESFVWKRDNTPKTITLEHQPMAKYVKILVTKAVGNFGSGKEIYVFKVPHSESYIPGDITGDGKIDRNDLVSYTNYTGLRRGDSDFEGYVSRGDLNDNDLIDAYDISVVATQLDGGISLNNMQPVQGALVLSPNKVKSKAGEEVIIAVKGESLSHVNALSFAIPYASSDYQFVGVERHDIAQMENLTYDRLHTNGNKALYVTFVNVGDQALVDGNNVLFYIKLKALKNVDNRKLTPTDGLLVGKDLSVIHLFE